MKKLSFFLLSSVLFFACSDGSDGADGKDGASCITEALKDSGGFKVLCDGDSVGVCILGVQ